MGKEAKIGLAVIAILLIVFGVVLAKRLTGSASADQQSTAEESKDGTSGSPSDSQDGSGSRSRSPNVLSIKASSNSPPDRSSAEQRDWQYENDPAHPGEGYPSGKAFRNYGMPTGSAGAATGVEDADAPPQPPLNKQHRAAILQLDCQCRQQE